MNEMNLLGTRSGTWGIRSMPAGIWPSGSLSTTER